MAQEVNMKKIRKGTQLSMFNRKNAGRPAKNDIGIRHISRPFLERPTSLHLTVKIKRDKADLKNKTILQLLKRAILRARGKGLRIIHYSLEYDHVHMLVEADDNATLGVGMQSFGVTLARGINKIKSGAGEVYKHRYHFRKISSALELKRVMSYIFKNGIKHGTAANIINAFSSIRAERKWYLFSDHRIEADFELIRILDQPFIHYKGVEYA